MLGYIGSVEVVMVFDTAFVFVVDLNDKLQEFVIVDKLEQIVHFENACRHERHLHIPAY